MYFSNESELKGFYTYIHKKKNKITSIKMFAKLISSKGRNEKISFFNKVIRTIG